MPATTEADPTTAELVALLLQPRAYPHRPDDVEHFETPISHVFVAPPFAYKLKKPVKLPFLDFRQRHHRRAVCEDEIRLNRRLCAPLYLGVVDIVRTDANDLRVGGPGRPVEPLVWMRALPADGMLPEALATNRVDERHLEGFARDLTTFHAGAPHEPPENARPTPPQLNVRWRDVLDTCAELPPTVLPAADRAVLYDFGPMFVARHANLFWDRLVHGRVREGHGDLHGANLCLVDRPLPAEASAPSVPAGLYAFDCIEFSESLRWNDVASEVAFLSMDLQMRGRADLARAFTDAYEHHAKDPSLASVLPYYEIHRATVRGMVHGQTASDSRRPEAVRRTAATRARAFFAFAARRAWAETGPVLLACAGFSGSGKTALAAGLAERSGFVHLSSDELRKTAIGLDPAAAATTAQARRLYGDTSRGRVYEALGGRARALLEQGKSVVADATFLSRPHRDALRAAARDTGAPCLFLRCDAREEVLRERLESRARAPVPTAHRARSDADWAVVQQQKRDADAWSDDETFLSIDTAPKLDALVETTLGRVWEWTKTATDGGESQRPTRST